MTVEFVSRPDVTRADAGLVKARTWVAGHVRPVGLDVDHHDTAGLTAVG